MTVWIGMCLVWIAFALLVFAVVIHHAVGIGILVCRITLETVRGGSLDELNGASSLSQPRSVSLAS